MGNKIKIAVDKIKVFLPFFLACFSLNKSQFFLLYYLILYYLYNIQIKILIILFHFSVDKSLWFVYPAMVGHYVAFFGGIFFMLCYYIWFHPTGIEMPFFQFLQV